jgi:long-subunit fatty acid transport protein
LSQRALSPATVALIATGLGLLVSPALASNGARLTAYGVRAAGRGGVDYAFADDATAPATNPAGMAFIPNRLDQTWVAAQADVDYHNAFGDWHMAPNTTVALPAYSFGVVFDPTQKWHVADLFDLGNWGLKPSAKDPPEDDWERSRSFADTEPPGSGEKVEGASVPGASVPGTSPPPSSSSEPSEEEMYGSPFRIGFGVFPVKGGLFSFAHIATPFFSPGAPEYTTSATELSLAPSFAVRIGKHFSIGLSPQFRYGILKLTSPIEQPRTVLAPEFVTASQLVNSSTVQTFANSHNLSTFGISGRIGAMFTLPNQFSLGVAYQDRSYLQDYLGGATVFAGSQVNALTFGSPGVLSLIDPRINVANGFVTKYNMRVQKGIQSPRQAGLGFAFYPFSRLSLGFDYTWIHWSEVMRVLQVRLTDPTNENLAVLSGSTVHVKVPLEWRDQHVLAAGTSIVVLQGDDIIPDEPSYKLILRFGYNWAQRPFRASNVLPQTPVFFEHHASCGLTFQWGPYLDFSLAYEHSFFSSVHTKINNTDSDLSWSHETAYLDTIFAGVGVNF